jgi:hypothetical protein
MSDIPRRNDLHRNSAEELMIRKCIHEVEQIGAHPILTECVILLDAARHKLADWIDGDKRP